MNIYAADFETTTDPDDCRVWAYALCPVLEHENVIYGNNLDDFFSFCRKEDLTLYFHNLKFDGEFMIVWLFEHGYRFVADRRALKPNTFTTLISSMGQFYSMEICHDLGHSMESKTKIIDSLKILPFTVDKIASAFNLPISKLSIDYDEYRAPGHVLTDDEIDYISNDVIIVASALKIMFDQNLKQMTQGSNALKDYKRIITTKKFDHLYPVPDYDRDIRNAYRGGWTYANPTFPGQGNWGRNCP